MKIAACEVMKASSCPRSDSEEAGGQRDHPEEVRCKVPTLPGSPHSPETRPESRLLRVRVDDSVFEVDRALLGRGSEYFRALFRSGMQESRQEEIRLRGAGGALGFLTALSVLRGERPVLQGGDQIVAAVECAAFLQVGALTEHLIHGALDSDSCLLALHAAATFGLWELRRAAALLVRDVYCPATADLLREHLSGARLPAELVRYVESLAPSSYVAVCTHSPATATAPATTAQATLLLRGSQRTVFHLDEQSAGGEWKALTDLPMRASTTMAGVTVHDNRLYIVGGVHDVSKKVVEGGFCYDPASGVWSAIPGPRQPRYNLTLIGHAGCLYALGGEYERKAMASVERYSVSDASWSVASPLPCPVASVPCAKAMNRIFVCLWRAHGATQIHEYVPQTDRWVLLTALVRPQSYGHCMVAHQDKVYVMRNGPCDDFLLCVMDVYSLTSGQWASVRGQYPNSNCSLFTAAVRGDSAFTLDQAVTTEYAIEERGWKTRRRMKGFGRIGSMYTFMMRLPKAAAVDVDGDVAATAVRHKKNNATTRDVLTKTSRGRNLVADSGGKSTRVLCLSNSINAAT